MILEHGIIRTLDPAAPTVATLGIEGQTVASTPAGSVSPEELGDVHVVATMVGGRWVHNPPPWD